MSTTIKVPFTFIVLAVEAGILRTDISKLREIYLNYLLYLTTLELSDTIFFCYLGALTLSKLPLLIKPDMKNTRRAGDVTFFTVICCFGVGCGLKYVCVVRVHVECVLHQSGGDQYVDMFGSLRGNLVWPLQDWRGKLTFSIQTPISFLSNLKSEGERFLFVNVWAC